MVVRGKPEIRAPWGIGTFAYLANRIAGTVLALYLITHILVLSTGARSHAGFDSWMEQLHSPLWLSLEMLLVLAVLFHGINGIRLMLIDAGMQPRKQKLLFWWAAGLTAIGMVVAAIICVPVIISRL